MKEVFKYNVSFAKPEFKDLITKMIFIAQALGFDKKAWVTGKELELLVEITRQFYQGIPLDSRESVLGIIENTSFSEKDKNVYVYRSKLVDKGWVRLTEEGLDLIPFLKTLEPDSDNTELAISINSL